MNDLSSTVSSLSADVETLKSAKSNKSGSSNLVALVGKRITELERKVSASQQYSRRDSIELAGVPESIENKNLESWAIKALGAIGTKVKSSDIHACHRLYKKEQVIIKFVNRKHAIDSLKNRSKLKTIKPDAVGLPPDSKRLFLNESLCPAYKTLLWKAGQLYKNGKIKNSWSFNGTVKIRLQNDDVKSIYHDDDLEALEL